MMLGNNQGLHITTRNSDIYDRTAVASLLIDFSEVVLFMFDCPEDPVSAPQDNE